MSHDATTSCDWRDCTQRARFAPTQRPPLNWYLVTHPVVVVRSKSSTLRQGLSTFCSPAHVAAWAAEFGQPDGAS